MNTHLQNYETSTEQSATTEGAYHARRAVFTAFIGTALAANTEIMVGTKAAGVVLLVGLGAATLEGVKAFRADR